MRAVLLWLVGVTAMGVAISAAVAVGTVWWLRRRNRVARRLPSAAPVSWLWSPRRAARLHRRLQAAASMPRVAERRPRRPTRSTQVGALAEAIEIHAAGLDDLVVVAGRARGAPRGWGLDGLEAQVVQVEALARRIALLEVGSAGDAGRPKPESLTAISERLDALQAARQELRQIETAVGLDRRAG